MKKVAYQDYENALVKAIESIGCKDISLYNVGGRPYHLVSIGVNWYASGTVSPEKAEEFADLLKKAAKVAREFPYNGYRIEF